MAQLSKLSTRTQAEQARGRGLVELAEALGKLADQQRRLERLLPPEVRLEIRSDRELKPANEAMVEITVVHPDRKRSYFNEPFVDFASDTLITKLLLVAG